MEERHGLYQDERGDTLPGPGAERRADGQPEGRDDMRTSPPIYTREEHGHDQDQAVIPASTVDRMKRSGRYGGKREALVTQLNQGSTTLAEMVTHLRGGSGVNDPVQRIARVVIYLRVSTEEQARVGGEAEGFSIPYQREVCLDKVRQLGGIFVEEYVDAGESAKSADRPELQRMLKDLKAKKIDYVIVHKIDRLARNRADDVAINTAIARAGAKLVSVAEAVDETPSGKLLYNMMAGVAQYYSDNLAVEVLKGMTTKAKRGGTPYRAPLGYLNKTEITDGARVSWIIVDPERAPLIRWTFEQYALGTWPIRLLVDALNEKGLRTRPSRKLTAKPITISGLHHMLRNPYYMGVVPYQGIYHEGKHEPLISPGLWLRVQDVLTAHNISGEKDRIHNHYLKGTIYCGDCKSRLIFSRNKGNGGSYDYYTCLSRRTGRKVCTRKPMRLEKIEDGVADFYEGFQLSPEKVVRLRQGICDELAWEQGVAAEDAIRAERRVRDIKEQRQKLLSAHYAGAVPLDMLKIEMDRLTRELTEAEKSIAASKTASAKLEETLDRALEIAGNCARAYLGEETTPAVRRRFNQGLFKKLFIAQDGQVERLEMTEPFATVLDPNLLGELATERVQRETKLEAADQQGSTLVDATSLQNMVEETEAAGKVFAYLSGTQKSDDKIVRLGLHKNTLVRERGLEPPRPQWTPAPQAGASTNSAIRA